MMIPQSIIVIQTAFIGDAVLTLPMIQRLKKQYPESSIDVIAIPRTAEIFRFHPAVSNVLVYDKRKTDRGIPGILRMIRTLAAHKYDLALVPHRSIRSAIIPALARIPVRVGFDTSAGAFLMTHRAAYRPDLHEIERDLTLLREIGIPQTGKELPSLYPTENDDDVVETILREAGIPAGTPLVAIAPGSVWATKRWLPERYAGLIATLYGKGIRSVLVGGKEDEALCSRISSDSGSTALVAAGRLTLLQSAALLRRAKVLVTNDTAPMHLAVAVRTPVVAVFGATVPAFGFSPYGESDTIVEIAGLSCRPCSIHGGNRCPIGTFDCMERISMHTVLEEVFKKT